MSKSTLSTIIKFEFKENTFNVEVDEDIKAQTKYRPSLDKLITDTLIAMVNSVFHTTNYSLQQQIKKYKLIYKCLIILTCLIFFAFIIVYSVLVQNRFSSDVKYSEIHLNDATFNMTWGIICLAFVFSLFLCVTYRRVYITIRSQWRRECIGNLSQSIGIWAVQYPIIQYEIRCPEFIYETLLRRSKRRAMKAFKDSRKKAKKKKNTKPHISQMFSPMRSPGFINCITSPAKYDALTNPREYEEKETLNICKMALCCCLMEQDSGFLRVFYKYETFSNNDALRYALHELQKMNYLVNEDEDEPQERTVQIIQMIQQASAKQKRRATGQSSRRSLQDAPSSILMSAPVIDSEENDTDDDTDDDEYSSPVEASIVE